MGHDGAGSGHPYFLILKNDVGYKFKDALICLLALFGSMIFITLVF